jgi:hypothetical protein
MKHLKKIFEDKKDEFIEIIESIFSDQIDDDTAYIAQGKKGLHKKNKDYLTVFLSKEGCPDAGPTSIEEFNEHIQSMKDDISVIEKIRPSLKRIDYYNFSWSMSITNEDVVIKIFRNKDNITLSDAFGGIKSMTSVDDSIMKKILKEKYNLTYNSHRYTPETRGYYGSNAEFLLYLSEIIEDNHPILNDIRNLEYEYESWSTSMPVGTYKTEREKAFGEVSVLRWEKSSAIKIKLR